ncbi:response regulator [Ulvibacter antarcticus]|uniref:histidine kinase n=1 Tax=Ulvibacter antarcticus TaxID=442714 RepID=A0A3L9Z699_9FLAO|nr:response regulator [Ulvibacter antarcticus]RMA65805.1 phospho-acceptor domain-containing protein [Ulvibacter antarcticus]
MTKLYNFFLFFSFCFGLTAQNTLFVDTQIDIDEKDISAYFTTMLDSSNVYHAQGNYKRSLELNIDLLLKAFASENPLYIHEGYRLLGANYWAMNDTILARESFEKSKIFAEQANDARAMAYSYMDLASIYSENNALEKAFIYHEESIELFELSNDLEGLAKAHYKTVLSSIKMKDYRRAYLHILKARKLNKFDENSALSVGLDFYTGIYYAQKDNFEMADTYFMKAIREAEKANLSVELQRAYEEYNKSLLRQGKFEEAAIAQTMYEMYRQVNNEDVRLLETETLTAKLQVAEYRKDVQAAELQNQLQSEIVENKSKLNTFLLIVTACFLVLFVALFLAYRNRKSLVSELKLKNKEYLKAKEKSEKLAKAKSKFFSTVSHELRTPLYGVIGLSTILLEDKTLKKHESDLKSLKFSADYLLALINDVLQINKIDSNNLEDEQTSFNLRELIKTISSSFEYMRLQNKNKIHIHISDNIPQFIRGNSVRLSQILMNLIGNACKFTENGDIYIIAETTEVTEMVTAIKFYIKDTGIGIPADKQESVFEEFSQADSINYKYQGTGLGLPIVKKLLALSNSSVSLESEFGEGSMFSFTLLFEAIQQIEEKKEIIITDASLLINKNILIVDDNRINQTVTKKILEKNKVICDIAQNGEEAVCKARENEYDLILMDINMPVKNGMQATKEIRAFDKKIPIVALTAVEVEEMRFKIYESGMNDIIVKPYDISKFVQTILKHIAMDDPGSSRKSSNLRAV